MNIVRRTSDFRRIEMLPVRSWDVGQIDPQPLTEQLRCENGTMTLRPIQALALQEMMDADGLLGAIGVGHGKTIVSLLAPSVLPAERPLLLLPAQLKKLTERELLPEMRKHWKISPLLRIESYHEISNNPELLGGYRPDLIVADECHRIARCGSARTKRLLRYFNEYPETKFVGLSGTITRKSLEDYWHLLLMALKQKAPIPMKYNEMKTWAMALDDGIIEMERAHIGALRHFCDVEQLHPRRTLEEKRREARRGYQGRLTGTPGVVATSDTGVEASLTIERRTDVYGAVGVRPWIKDALKTLRDSWITPGGEEITDAVDYWRKAREIAMGFYYEWDWEEPNHEWLEARRNWRRYVRRQTQRVSTAWIVFDTEMLVTQACERGDLLSREYNEWITVKGDANPKTRTVWCSDDVLLDVIDLASDRNTIVWFEQKAVGEMLQQLTDWPVFQGGQDANLLLTAHVNHSGGPCAASIRAHGIGVNLQTFNDCIVLTPPASGATWEQLLGRTHRTGQKADEVSVTLYQHTKEYQDAFAKALENAKYIEESTGQKQKLNFASVAWCDGAE
jgi:hypothetical protein